MSRYTSISIFIILCVTTHRAVPQIAFTCVSGSSAPCGGLITESPSGPLDGINTSFRLRLPPISLSDLHVIVDGMVLNSSVDYTVAGQDLIFQPHSIPRPGDVLRVSYQSQFTDSMPLTDVSRAQDIKAIVDATLLRYATKQDQLNGPSERSSRTNLGTRDQPRSLSLLAERLVDQRREGLATGKPETGNGSLLQGVDGLGDNSGALIYRTLGVLSPHGLVDGAATGTRNRDAGNHGGEPRSLIVLEERLADARKSDELSRKE